MYKQVAFLVLLAVIGFSGQVNAECRFNRNYVQNSLGTLAKRENGKLHLQRFNWIDNNAVLELYCIQDNGKIVTSNIKCDKGKLNPSNPVTCKDTIVAKVQKVHDSECPAELYRVGIEIQGEFMELYRACYDKKQVRSYYSEAVVYWKPIHPTSPRPFFATDELITPLQASSFQSKNIYEAFVKIYDKHQNYIKRDKFKRAELVLNRGHLTAAGDMLFYDQMTSTFKYLNVVPQFESINSGNWLQIEHWVGNNIPKNGVLHVRTGALGVLSLLDFKPTRRLRPAYLIPEKQQNPVPEWMYKIVRNANNQLLHVFLTYNNIFNPTKPTAHQCCYVIGCPPRFPIVDSAILGFSYCCKPDYFVQCLSKH